MRGFLQSAHGDLSSKRLAGLFCVFSGVMGKITLVVYAACNLVSTPFEQLDNCLDTIIYAGAALLGAGLVELFSKKNANQNNDSIT